MRLSVLLQHILCRQRIATFALPALLFCSCEKENAHDTWEVYRGDIANTAYSSLTQINRDNVKSLGVAWTFQTGEGSKDSWQVIECNPIMTNGMLYLTSARMKLIALEPSTGREIWRFDPFEGGDAAGVNRGVTFWKDGNDKRIFFAAGSYLYALNADDGSAVAGFGTEGKVDLRIGLGRDPATLGVTASSPGIVYRDLLILGSAVGEGYDAAPGFIRAYNARTGAIAWTFHTIPQPGEPGYETWPPDAHKNIGSVNSWAGMSLDEKRGIVYIPTGSAAFDFYGGNRKGKNLYANCLLALEAATGKLIWHYQLVHHDLWDYDLPAPPNLLTVMHEGKKVDAVAQVTKMGMVFVFNRETGEPLFPIEERPVPASTLPGEEASATQPFPVKPPPFSRHHFTTEDVTGISPESRNFILEKIKGANHGTIYTPPSTNGIVQFPGTRGGAEWGGASVDPTSAIMYVNANDIPLLISMKEVEIEGQEKLLASAGKRIYNVNACSSCHGSERDGNTMFPSLINLSEKRTEKYVTDLLRTGKGQMPAFPNLSDEDVAALMAFLFDRNDIPNPKVLNVKNPSEQEHRFAHSGWNVLLDQDGYPGVKPPWGTLNAIDLNKGEILWQVPLGVYPELIAKGLPPTGTQNLGGPAVTAGGLVFIGATRDRKFRAFDKDTGEILWEHELPGGGNATPAIYQVNGKEYVVVAAGGGGRVGSPPSDSYVAFALKE